MSHFTDEDWRNHTAGHTTGNWQSTKPPLGFGDHVTWALYSITKDIESWGGERWWEDDAEFPKLVSGRPVGPNPRTIYSQFRVFHTIYPDLLCDLIFSLILFYLDPISF